MVKTALFGIITAMCLFLSVQHVQATPSIEEYAKEAGEGAKIIPAGQLKLNGYRAICGRRPTVLNPGFDDYGGAFPNANPGYIILNPKKMKGLSTVVQFYVYLHECGHQMRGHSEEGADCYAVQKGRRTGWLDEKGMQEICDFMWSHKADFTHAAGPERCKSMKACFKAAAPRKKKP